MSKLKLSINYKSLELELQEALRADELYKLQNDVKLRAVEQNVPTYEDFRQLVNAAHLKPLKHVKPKMYKLWNPIVNTLCSNTVMSFDKSNKIQSKGYEKLSPKNNYAFGDEIPTTYKQFLQVWKSIQEHEAKFNYLKVMRHVLLDNIFRTEIHSTMFVELIDVCRRNVSVLDNIKPIVDILTVLSKCNRFSLAVTFLGKNEKEVCTQLFRNLFNSEYQNGTFKDSIKMLAMLYEVILV